MFNNILRFCCFFSLLTLFPFIVFIQEWNSSQNCFLFWQHNHDHSHLKKTPQNCSWSWNTILSLNISLSLIIFSSVIAPLKSLTLSLHTFFLKPSYNCHCYESSEVKISSSYIIKSFQLSDLFICHNELHIELLHVTSSNLF